MRPAVDRQNDAITAIVLAAIADAFPPVSVVVDSAGRYVVTGALSTNANPPAEASFVGRLLETGAQDPQFTLRAVPTTAGTPSIHGVGLASNDSVLLSGLVAPDDVLVLQYNSVGSLDASFNGGLPLKLSGKGAASHVVSTSQGVVIAGRTQSPAPIDMLVMRLDAAGQADTTFATDGVFTKHYSEGGGNADLALRVVQDPYGRLVVGGRRVPTGGSRWNFVFFRLFP